jgi:hypothetical protein
MSQQRVAQTNQQTQPAPPLASGVLQRQCVECRNQGFALQRQAINQAEPDTAPPVVPEVLRSPDQPLESATRAFREPRFGHDFSRVSVHNELSGVIQPKPTISQLGDPLERVADQTPEAVMRIPDPLKTGLEQLSDTDLSGVRVHYNSSKAAQLNALAYTQGQDIYVGPGQEKHLPHEGWHAVQQMQGRVKPTMRAHGLSMNDEERLEREADIMGAKARHMETRGVQPDAPGVTTQRECSSYSEDESLAQKKSIQKDVGNHPQPEIQRLETVRGISQLSDAQLQSSDETDDGEKRTEYEALQPESGTGPGANPASPAGPSSSRRRDEAPSQLLSSAVLQRAGCTPSNTAVGNNALDWVRRTRASWRSHVTYEYSIDNQNDHLTINGYVFAKAYYGLWITWEEFDLNATVDLTCQTVNGTCEISANERGGSVFDLMDSPASGAIAVQTDRRAGGTQMALTIRVGGAVGANSSVSAGVGPASVGVSFPDASISHKVSMGTFIYTCAD